MVIINSIEVCWKQGKKIKTIFFLRQRFDFILSHLQGYNIRHLNEIYVNARERNRFSRVCPTICIFRYATMVRFFTMNMTI